MGRAKAGYLRSGQSEPMRGIIEGSVLRRGSIILLSVDGVRLDKHKIELIIFIQIQIVGSLKRMIQRKSFLPLQLVKTLGKLERKKSLYLY